MSSLRRSGRSCGKVSELRSGFPVACAGGMPAGMAALSDSALACRLRGSMGSCAVDAPGGGGRVAALASAKGGEIKLAASCVSDMLDAASGLMWLICASSGDRMSAPVARADLLLKSCRGCFSLSLPSTHSYLFGGSHLKLAKMPI